MEENINNDYSDFTIGDATYRTILTTKFKSRKAYSKIKIKEIHSFIPGTITEINIKAGSKVAKGDIILILEAMKMKNKIIAPMAGIIESVNVKIGDIVPKNSLLAVIK
ncbi:MAG: hypothetical protein AUJ98_02480 [Bacteroidetes bacterium CG2_30_33_31]|nr:MAG: hypothetical protein AUJ98_02480 [Bacteroidetes bacterium CG2_30_33_31]